MFHATDPAHQPRYRWMAFWVTAALLMVAGTARAAQADELDLLIKDSRLPLMFQAHRPDFSAVDAKVKVVSGGIVQTQTWRALKDGRRFAGLIRPDGNLILFSFSPFETLTNLPTIRGGWHLDTGYGHFIRTDIGLNTDGSSALPELEVSGSGPAITFVRRQKRGFFRTGPDVLNTVHLAFNPYVGYILDATAEVTRLTGLAEIETARLAPPGRCRVWPGEATIVRLATTAVGGGFDGIVTVPAEWERHSGTNEALTCRNGGFVTMTDTEGYFSPAVTVSGADVRLRMNPSDGSVSMLAPVNARARQLVMRHRYLFLPGIATGMVLEQLKPRHAKEKAIVLRLDRKEELEDQPLPLTINARGLVGPELILTTNLARSGKQALVVTGTVHVAGPPIPLEPRTRYELSAYAHVVAKPVPGEPEPAAYLSARFFTWPDTNADIGLVERTDVAHYIAPPPPPPKKDPKKKDEKPKEDPKLIEGQWKKVMLEFATGDAEICAEVSFHAPDSQAYFDDFRFLKLGKYTNGPARMGTMAVVRADTNGAPRVGPNGEPRRRRRPQ